MAVIVCWRSGEVEVCSREIEGAMVLMRGPAKRLAPLLCGAARHAYDGVTMLVPGIPEADNDGDALKAALDFQSRLERNLLAKKKKSAGGE